MGRSIPTHAHVHNSPRMPPCSVYVAVAGVLAVKGKLEEQILQKTLGRSSGVKGNQELMVLVRGKLRAPVLTWLRGSHTSMWSPASLAGCSVVKRSRTGEFRTLVKDCGQRGMWAGGQPGRGKDAEVSTRLPSG